ncbi:MAG: nucleotide exchange factor GrpE, partial [Rickettsiales bacterium]|nr:nucleotide exchange factor GrpE [Rickettsiales bacterium]
MEEKAKEDENFGGEGESNFDNLDKELTALNDRDDNIKELTEQNQKLAEENGQLKDKFLRAVAEVENVRRRANEEKEKTSKYAISNFALGLVPIMENFFLAFGNIGEKNSEKVFFEGMKLTFNELKKVFERFGLRRIYPLGEKFDADFHQAIGQVESKEEEGVVVEVAQAGYVLN